MAGPSQPTPNRDDGYDIADYYGIDRRLGSSGDFAEFMREADGRGIRVLLDLVVNHTSDRHPWFLERAQASELTVPRLVRLVESGRRTSARAWSSRGCSGRPGRTHADARAWYFHRFYDFQPDLNIDNPAVREEIQRIIGYWLRLGAAGFRVDAVPFLIEKPAATEATALRVPARAADGCSGGAATRSSSARRTSSRATTTSTSPAARACT